VPRSRDQVRARLKEEKWYGKFQRAANNGEETDAQHDRKLS
jgi:hypothetical protein